MTIKKTAGQLKAEQRAARAEQGFVQRTVWVHKDDLWQFGQMLKRLPNRKKYKRKNAAECS